MANTSKNTRSKEQKEQVVNQICLDNAEAVCQKLVELALAGDSNACKYIYDRARPMRKGTPFKLDMPSKITTAEELDEASARTLKMLANAEISLEESTMLYGLLDFRYKTIEMRDISVRLAEVKQDVDIIKTKGG